MTTGTKEVFFCLVFLPPTKRTGHSFLFGSLVFLPQRKQKHPATLCPLMLSFFCQKTLPFFFFGFFPLQNFLPLLQIYANQIFASILKPAFLITAAGVGMTLIALKILSKHPGYRFWAKPKHLKRKTLLDMEGTAGNCGENGVWGGG